jgi:catechol 2,3-dioxygenase-like lactoylglutathione lyase family enzyme
MSASAIATNVRFHLSLNVSDLTRAVQFYRTLFGEEPAKHHPDYAKFEMDEPPLVLSLQPNRHTGGGALNHVGLRLPDSASLIALQQRLEAADIPTQREEGVECCHSRQTKFWVTDPDRTLWEIYLLEDDSDPAQGGQTQEILRLSCETSDSVWEHRLGESFPDPLPQPDGAVNEVMLQGTLNAALPAEEERILREVYRVLSPGGRVALHLLVGDKPFPNGKPSLPGPAACVQKLPVDTDVWQLLDRVGFVGLTLTKFDADPWFQQFGVAMRELRIIAWKPDDNLCAPGGVVLYKGPFRQVSDEEGSVYRRGERTVVNARSWKLLKGGTAAEQFMFVPAVQTRLGLGSGSGCCSDARTPRP